jgi:hypothetical protein
MTDRFLQASVMLDQLDQASVMLDQLDMRSSRRQQAASCGCCHSSSSRLRLSRG